MWLEGLDLAIYGLDSKCKCIEAGIVHWDFQDSKGIKAVITVTAYVIPTAAVRLFIPQDLFATHRTGTYTLKWDSSEFEFKGIKLEIPYNSGNHLPMLLEDKDLLYHDQRVLTVTTSDLKEVYNSVGLQLNQNLTSSQKELLLWNWKLGHSNMHWIQNLMKHKEYTDSDGITVVKKSVVTPKFKTTSTIKPPLCAACLLGKAKRRGAGTSKESKTVSSSLKMECLLPGTMVSTDHYETRVKGRLQTTRGREREDEQYSGGTIFVDHASSFIFINNQVSLRAGETLQSKQLLVGTNVAVTVIALITLLRQCNYINYFSGAT